MKKAILTLVLSVVVLAGLAQTQYTHPGIDLTQADLDRIKEKVNARQQPWFDGWSKLLAERDARSDFKASPKSTVGGSNGTRQRASRDAVAAYYNILRWYVTGNTDNAECAVNILNAWSSSVTSVVTGELFMLPIRDFMKAAELVRLYPGWQQADRERFATMARDYFYPPCKEYRDRSDTWPGWGAPANFCCLAIGIYLDDEEMVSEAIDNYKNGKGGGCIHQGILPSGQCTEMGRDQPHAEIGINCYSDFCRAAWDQGIDLYSYADNLLAKGYEYLCHFNLDHADKVEWEPGTYCGHTFFYPANNNSAPGSMPQNRIYGGLQYEKAYHHYTEVGKIAMPWTRLMINLRPSSTLRGTLWTVSDTTTLYNKQPKPSAPINLTATPGVGRIYLDWDAAVPNRTNGYVIQRSVNQSSGFKTLITFTENCSSEYVDTNVSSDTTYYYRVRAVNQSGSSGWSAKVSARPAAYTATLPEGWTVTDLGDVALAGKTVWADAQDGTWTLTGSGVDNWNGRQAIGNFTHTAVKGDFDIKMRIADCVQNGNEIKVKVGIAVFETLATDSKSVFMQLEGTGTRFARISWRNAGATKLESVLGCDHTWSPVWFRLKREGDTFTGYQSLDGEKWFEIGSCDLTMADNVNAGLFVCSGAYHEEGFTATFDHLSITSGDAPTAIDAVNANGQAEAAVYDLSGRKMDDKSLMPGVYIKNHRKFVVR